MTNDNLLEIIRHTQESIFETLSYKLFSSKGRDYKALYNCHLVENTLMAEELTKFLYRFLLPKAISHLKPSEYWYAIPVSPQVITWAYSFKTYRVIEVDL